MEHYDLSIKPMISRHGVRAAFIYRSFLDLSHRVSLSFSAALYLCAIYLPPRSGTSVGLGHIILREEPLSILRGRARQHSGFQADSRYYSRTEGGKGEERRGTREPLRVACHAAGIDK